jgi:peptidoglycan-associated lipoprotein
MKRMFVRLPVVLCLLGIAYLPMTGGSCKKEQPTAEIEAPAPEPAPTPKPTPEPPQEDPNAWKAQVRDVFFDYDKYELRSDARALLQENARLLKEKGANVVLEGHCDERGTEEYNLALGERRAGAVRAYLADLGVGSSMMSTISYGEEKPFAMGHDESAWSQNRRVHFRIE